MSINGPKKSSGGKKTPFSVPPPDFLHNGLKFSFSAEGLTTFNGETNEEVSKLIWLLTPHSTGYSRKLFTWPPKSKTQKWWRAMCAFRDLDPTGSVEELQNRLHTFLVAEKEKKNDGQPFTTFPELEMASRSKMDEVRAWRARNSAGESAAWDTWSAEEKSKKNFNKFIRESFPGENDEDPTSRKDVYVLPRTRKLDWAEADYLIPHATRIPCTFAMVFTAAPPIETRYYRGSLVGYGWCMDYDRLDALYDEDARLFSGKTWVGTGFSRGVIVGKTKEIVSAKIREMCSDIEKEIVGRHVKQLLGDAAAAKSQDIQDREDSEPATLFRSSLTRDVENEVSSTARGNEVPPRKRKESVDYTEMDDTGESGEPPRRRGRPNKKPRSEGDDFANEAPIPQRRPGRPSKSPLAENLHRTETTPSPIERSGSPPEAPQVEASTTTNISGAKPNKVLPLTWTLEEEIKARAIWKLEEAEKPVYSPSSQAKYKNGDLLKETVARQPGFNSIAAVVGWDMYEEHCGLAEEANEPEPDEWLVRRGIDPNDRPDESGLY